MVIEYFPFWLVVSRPAEPILRGSFWRMLQLACGNRKMHLVEGCHIAALQIVRSPGLDLAQRGVAKDFPG
jgi:hypothetical protein